LILFFPLSNHPLVPSHYLDYTQGYGIATPKGSIWRDKISLAILELQEKGTIQILYDKWWKNTGEICSRDEKNKESKANALGVENIGGVFVVLLCGLAFAILVAILEFCWNSKKNAQTDRQSLCSEMAEELRFAVRCHGSRQRPALKRNCVKCSPGQHTYVPQHQTFGLPHHYGVISLSHSFFMSTLFRIYHIFMPYSKKFSIKTFPYQWWS
jgi:glutamate receptor, ionotropic, invertebrate